MDWLLRLVAIAAGFTLVMHAHAQAVPAGVVMLDIQKAKWEKSATGETAKVIGDQAKPGPYLYLTKPRAAPSAANRPHTHPDTRTYTVIAGTWYVGFGEQFDESKLIALKPGSVYTEPAGVPHFVVIKDEGTIVQISGTGPSRLIPVGEATKP